MCVQLTPSMAWSQTCRWTFCRLCPAKLRSLLLTTSDITTNGLLELSPVKSDRVPLAWSQPVTWLLPGHTPTSWETRALHFSRWLQVLGMPLVFLSYWNRVLPKTSPVSKHPKQKRKPFSMASAFSCLPLWIILLIHPNKMETEFTYTAWSALTKSNMWNIRCQVPLCFMQCTLAHLGICFERPCHTSSSSLCDDHVMVTRRVTEGRRSYTLPLVTWDHEGLSRPRTVQS